MMSWTVCANMKRPLWKKCSKQESVALLARGRQCSHATHINILHSIHFASNSLQLLSCKMIASHRRREQLVILLLMWALWIEKGCHILADKRPEHNNTIKERSEKSEECEEWESKISLRGWTKSVFTLKPETCLEILLSYVYEFVQASRAHAAEGSLYCVLTFQYAATCVYGGRMCGYALHLSWLPVRASSGYSFCLF